MIETIIHLLIDVALVLLEFTQRVRLDLFDLGTLT
jgi:hypothetical protein